MSALMIVMVVGFISCKKTTTNPQDNPPGVTLQAGTGYISANTTVTTNDSLKFGIRATSNTSTGAKVTTLTFARSFNGQSYTQDYSMPGDNVDLKTKANSAAGKETFTLTVKDANGATASVQVVVTTVAHQAGLHRVIKCLS